MSAPTVREYVAHMEGLGFRFAAYRRGLQRELCVGFPFSIPRGRDDIASAFGRDRDEEVFLFIAERDGIRDLPHVADVLRPTFPARPRHDNHGGDAA